MFPLAVIHSVLRKNEEEIVTEKDVSHIKIDLRSRQQKKTSKKRKRKRKNKEKSNDNNKHYVILLLFI